tara:strand:- start:329 stop:502 length:174 start_codon:yes stop_codon:yes gene_type:complete
MIYIKIIWNGVAVVGIGMKRVIQKRKVGANGVLMQKSTIPILFLARDVGYGLGKEIK